MSTDKFDNVPRIVLEKEDRDSFQRTRAAQKTKPEPEVPQDSPPPSKSSGGLLVFVLLLALGGYGGSYWLYTLQQKTANQLENASERIYELERKISATGEELDQSAVALRVQVNELKDKTDVLWQEMDKLWASAWRRNQTEIKELQTQTTNEFKNQKATLTALRSDISESNTNMAVIQEQVNQQLARAKEINSSLESVVKQRAASEQQIRDMGDQVATVALRIEALIERIDALESLKQEVSTIKSQNAARSAPPAVVQQPPATGTQAGQ